MHSRYEGVPILTPTESYVTRYQPAVDSADKQLSIIWFANELGVEKDEHDVRVKMTDGERHGLTYVLRIFTKYETLLGGDEFWGGKVKQMFPRPDIHRMASVFSCIELAVHGPFYDLINKTLGLSSDEFYESWKEDDRLVDRVNYIKRYAESDDPLEFTAAFAFMEGAVLFSNFAYMKAANSGGYNLISHITSGIDASAKDENYHGMASAWLFNQTISELKEMGRYDPTFADEVEEKVFSIARAVYEHEILIAQGIFEKGDIRFITYDEMVHFIKNRIDAVLGYLGFDALFGIEQGKIAGWFYSALNTYKYSDFFANQQIQYVRNWNKGKLTFKADVE